MNPLRILVADDEDSILSLLEQLLKNDGHSVVAARNAREACEAIGRQPFDLVITDMLMPDGDGIDLITKAKTVQPDARILAMSGGGRYVEGGDYLKLAKAMGADVAVTKPFDLRQFMAAIAIAIRSCSGLETQQGLAET
jgi:DNA-binding NtrC family response regulator